MTLRPTWEVDDATRDAWVAVLRRVPASSEVDQAPQGWRGWYSAAERTSLGKTTSLGSVGPSRAVRAYPPALGDVHEGSTCGATDRWGSPKRRN